MRRPGAVDPESEDAAAMNFTVTFLKWVRRSAPGTSALVGANATLDHPLAPDRRDRPIVFPLRTGPPGGRVAAAISIAQSLRTQCGDLSTELC